MMWFFWIPFVLLPLCVILMFRRGEHVGCHAMAGHGRMTSPLPTPKYTDPVEIVRERLARGEITPEEYEQVRRALG